MKKQKGFAALVVVMIAAILAILSYLVIDFGSRSILLAKEKQILDGCSISLGQRLIETNDINNICNPEFLNRCSSFTNENVNPDFNCEDAGLECNNNGECFRRFNISSTFTLDDGDTYTTRNVAITIAEETHDVNLIDAAVILLLDYSGSMNGNRIAQLKSTVSQFINSNFNLSYSIILYNNEIITKTNIDKGQNHNAVSLNEVNRNNPNGGTSFIKPISEAISQIRNSRYEAYYILLISDGQPNEGANQSIEAINNNIMNIQDDACIYPTYNNPCISVYTLGVDNANIDILESLSGNTISTAADDFSFVVNANQVDAAFNAIIEEIMCRIGPVISDENLNVFNDLTKLENGTDYLYNRQHKILKFYDEDPVNICTQMINDNARLTIRWGEPKLYVEKQFQRN